MIVPIEYILSSSIDAGTCGGPAPCIMHGVLLAKIQALGNSDSDCSQAVSFFFGPANQQQNGVKASTDVKPLLQPWLPFYRPKAMVFGAHTVSWAPIWPIT